MDYHRWPLIAIAFALLVAACTNSNVPFPYQPNPPSQYPFHSDEFQGPVAMITYQCYRDSDPGLMCQKAASFDSAGCCTEYFYRDNHVCARLTFDYDSLHRRISETAYIDTAGTPFNSMTEPYTTTTYRYSRNKRRCIARVAGPNGRRYRFVFRYNAQGLISRFIYPDGSRISYYYDTLGTLTKTIRPDGSAIDIIPADQNAPQYRSIIYDNHRNWVRRTSASVSQPTQLEIRTFKYYDQL